MTEYEIVIEEINPCGDEQSANKRIVEIEIDSPDSYIAAYGRFPILDQAKNAAGDVVITTGDGSGNIVRYTFTE